MNLDEQAIFDAALNLPADRRRDLAEQLLETLADRDPDVERAWIEEAKRRLQAVREGRMPTIPADEAFRAIRERLRQ